MTLPRLFAATLFSSLCHFAVASPELTWHVVNRFPTLEAAEFQAVESRWKVGEHATMSSFIAARLQAKRSKSIPNTEFVLTDPRVSAKALLTAFDSASIPKVRVTLRDAPGPCSWSTSLAMVDFDGIPGACDVVFLAPYGAKHTVAAVSAGTSREIEIHVNDVVLVSMGDSYSSGEGSPDRPALYPDHETPQTNEWFLRPKSAPTDVAVWWDSPCHRSMLSWPVLAALRIALTNKNSTVRLVDVSCSGAEFMDGIFVSQKRVVIPDDNHALTSIRDGAPNPERWVPKPVFFKRSQVNQIRDVLCEPMPVDGTPISILLPKGREAVWRDCKKPKWKPDALMFTGGGNDAKFAPAVLGAMVPDKAQPGFGRKFTLNLVRNMMGVIDLKTLGAGAVALGDDYPALLREAAAGALALPETSILMKYPNPIARAPDGARTADCQTAGQADRIKASFMGFGPAGREMARQKGSPGTSVINWVVELRQDEVDDFMSVGFPGVQMMQSRVPIGMKSTDWEAADPARYSQRLLCSPSTGDVALESTFFCQGSECKKPFVRKQRLGEIAIEAPGRRIVNTSNDALLAQRSWKSHRPRETELNLALQGSMHPNAEAHALAADSMYTQLCLVLRQGGKLSACTDAP
jgi:hypothetical protein